MKLTTLLFIITLIQVSAKSYSQVTINENNVSLESVLNKIKKQTGYTFIYETDALQNITVTLAVKNASVESVLSQCFKGLRLTYQIINNNVVITKNNGPTVKRPIVPAMPPKSIKGRVQTVGGAPLFGATIKIKGAKKGVLSNEKGEFELENVPDNEIIQVTYVGFKPVEITVTPDNGALIVVLEVDVARLNEIRVSNGYNDLPQERATGSFGVITGKQLQNTPSPNIIQRLEGQVPGLLINIPQSDFTFTYRNPLQNTVDNNTNQNYNIQIRGLSTLNANQAPLIVVDGVVTDLDLRTLNPNDVEQITVLKDAAAASIWGVRAANGVLVIKTKRGRNFTKPTVSFSANFNIDGKPRLGYIPQLNAAQTIDYEKDLVDRGIIKDPLSTPYLPARALDQAQELLFQYQRGNITLAQRDAGLAALSKNDSYSQISKYLLQPATSNEYNLSIQGGSDDIKYFYSASYSKERTNEIGTDGRRITLTANQDFRLFKIATLSSSIKTSLFNFNYNGLAYSTLAPSTQQLLPYDQLVDATGKSVNFSYAYDAAILTDLEKNGYLNWRYNYIDELHNANNKVKTNNFSVNLNLNVPLYKGIAFNSIFAWEKNLQTSNYLYSDQTYTARNAVNDATSFAADGSLVHGIPLGGILDQGNSNQDNYTVRNQLSYNSTFSSNHLISAIAGIEIRQTSQSGSTYNYFGYNDQAQSFVPLRQLDNITEAVTGYQISVNNSGSIITDETRRFLSYYSNASYTYKNKYTISASGRIDDYNNFGYASQYRRRPLWSSGGSWYASKEQFLSNISWLSNLNLRLTYGVNGNVSLTNLPFTIYTPISTDFLTQQPYVSIQYPANPSFTYEKTAVLNGGVDFSLFKSRLSGTFDYYIKKGVDLLYSYLLDPTYGNTSIFRNGAKLNGNGFDISLNVVPVQTSNWRYTPGITFAYNTNKVISLPEFEPPIQAGNVGYLPGYATDYLFVYRWAGLDKNGQSTIYDQNGKVIDINTPLTSRDALKYAGRTSPPYFGGLNQNLKYKNFNLYVQLVGKFDYVFLRQSVRQYQTTPFYSSLDLSKDIAYRWKKPGDEAITNVPGLTGITPTSLDRYSNSSLLVEPGDHIRLRQVSLTYTLNDKVSQKLKLSNASFSAGARNLGIIWRKNKDGIDPDFQPSLSNATTIPPATAFTFSFNANF